MFQDDNKFIINTIKDYFSDKKQLLVKYILSILFYYPVEVLTFSYVASQIYTQINQRTIDKKKLTLNIIILLILYTLSNISKYYKEYLESIHLPGLLTYFRNQMFNKVLFRMKKQDASIKAGDVISRFIIIPNSIKEILMDLTGLILPKAVTLIVVIIALFCLNFKAGLINLLTLSIIGIIHWKRSIICFKHFIDRNKYFNHNNQTIQNKIYNLFNIIISNTVEQEIIECNNRENQHKESYTNSLLCSLKTNVFIILILIINLATILYLIASKLFRKEIKAEYAITTIILVTYLIPNINVISNLIPGVISNYGALSESEEFINFINKFVKTSGVKKNINGNINFDNVNFGYSKNDKCIFKNLNLSIKANSLTMIIGKSGTGKSTLMKLICGFYNVNSGSIKIDNTNIDNMDIDYLRNQIGMLTQNIRMFETSIIDNIKYGNDTIKDNDVYNFINKYKINVYQSLNNDLSTKIKPNETNLSGGQKQIALLIKTILSNKKILILDEPTSALDDYHFEVVRRIIFDLKGKKTLLIISHDNRFQKKEFDNVYQIKNQTFIPIN